MGFGLGFVQREFGGLSTSGGGAGLLHRRQGGGDHGRDLGPDAGEADAPGMFDGLAQPAQAAELVLRDHQRGGAAALVGGMLQLVELRLQRRLRRADLLQQLRAEGTLRLAGETPSSIDYSICRIKCDNGSLPMLQL